MGGTQSKKKKDSEPLKNVGWILKEMMEEEEKENKPARPNSLEVIKSCTSVPSYLAAPDKVSLHVENNKRNVIFKWAYEEGDRIDFQSLENDPYFILCCRLYCLDTQKTWMIDRTGNFSRDLSYIGYNHNLSNRVLNPQGLTQPFPPAVEARMRYGFGNKKFDLSQGTKYSRFKVGCRPYENRFMCLHGKVFTELKEVYEFLQLTPDDENDVVDYHHAGNVPDYSIKFDWEIKSCTSITCAYGDMDMGPCGMGHRGIGALGGY